VGAAVAPWGGAARSSRATAPHWRCPLPADAALSAPPATPRDPAPKGQALPWLERARRVARAGTARSWDESRADAALLEVAVRVCPTSAKPAQRKLGPGCWFDPWPPRDALAGSAGRAWEMGALAAGERLSAAVLEEDAAVSETCAGGRADDVAMRCGLNIASCRFLMARSTHRMRGLRHHHRNAGLRPAWRVSTRCGARRVDHGTAQVRDSRQRSRPGAMAEQMVDDSAQPQAQCACSILLYRRI